MFAALLIGITVALGAVAPVAAAARVPKVALIVGPVGSLTHYYRSLANEAATVAHKAGAQVVKVYSPNATWPAVKDAITGASIVVYLGHGNGWPSKYRDALFPPSQNGFGLNPIAGVDDSSHQYFGEASVEKVDLAPNAVVLLHHLCYASGNTEPGLAEGTLDQAIKRVDNYAAGFLKAGASAVVAEAHLGPAYYVGQLLTTKQSIEQIWNHSPNANGHLIRSASVRTPGYTARLDPDHASSGFYRSLVSRGVTADAMRSGGTGVTGVASIAVPVVPAEPSLTGASLVFGSIKLNGSPIAAARTRITVPLTSGTVKSVPKGVQVGIRWDPIVLDPQPAVAPSAPTSDPAAPTDPTSSGAGAIGGSAATGPSASAAPAADNPAGAAPSTGAGVTSDAGTPGVETAAPDTGAPVATEQPSQTVAHGLFTLPSDPPLDPSAAIAAPPPVAVVPQEAPPVDLVVPETLGSVVDLATVNRSKSGLIVGVTLPQAPGLYRLVPTLHTPSGVAYDEKTQALLTPVIVRVSGPIGVAYGAPTSITIPAATNASVPVRVVNTGSVAWDELVTAPPSNIAAETIRDYRTSRVRARLVGTWISTGGLVVPAPVTTPLDPEVTGPGGEAAAQLDLVAPPTPGEYLLLLDVVSPAEGTLSALGSAPAIIRVTVSGPGPSPTPVPPPAD